MNRMRLMFSGFAIAALLGVTSPAVWATAPTGVHMVLHFTNGEPDNWTASGAISDAGSWTLDRAPNGVEWLFGRHHACTRDAAYALVAEVFRVDDDRLRVPLLLTLEAAGHVFFGRVAQFVEHAGMGHALRYFSFSHLEVEHNHQVFDNELDRRIAAMELGPAVRASAIALVDRCYDAFNAMFDGLVLAQQGRAPVEACHAALAG